MHSLATRSGRPKQQPESVQLTPHISQAMHSDPASGEAEELDAYDAKPCPNCAHSGTPEAPSLCISSRLWCYGRDLGCRNAMKCNSNTPKSRRSHLPESSRPNDFKRPVKIPAQIARWHEQTAGRFKRCGKKVNQNWEISETRRAPCFDTLKRHP